MKELKVKYPTLIKQRKLGDKLFVLEVIRDLDEAIDLICAAMTPDEQRDPFAEDLCPYFGILWPAAEALSEYLFQQPELIKGKRVLELGCGLGYPSMVATHLGGEVLATDFHPEALTYYERNCRHSSLPSACERLNWREEGTDLKGFDVVMGSDILYESKHPGEVARGLLKFVRPGGTIILTDPGRSYLQQFMDAMNREGLSETISTISIDGKENFVLKYLT